MGTAKKSIEALTKNLTLVEKRIKLREDQLRRDRELWKKLTAQITSAQAGELMGIIEQRELSFEQAKDILVRAEKFTEKEEAENE